MFSTLNGTFVIVTFVTLIAFQLVQSDGPPNYNDPHSRTRETPELVHNRCSPGVEFEFTGETTKEILARPQLTCEKFCQDKLLFPMWGMERVSGRKLFCCCVKK